MSIRKIFAGVILALGVALAPGCLYANIKIPLDRDLDQTQLGSKVGSAKIYSILWLFAWGDAGTQAAAAAGGIKTVNLADQKILSILFGLYYEQTTIVYGD